MSEAATLSWIREQGLGGRQFRVQRVRSDEFGVGAEGLHLPGVYHDDPAGHGDRGQPVREDQHDGGAGGI
ncbi:MAG: hypothetical protein ACRDNZ_07690 [Streptosporangiaceae bacterium]